MSISSSNQHTCNDTSGMPKVVRPRKGRSGDGSVAPPTMRLITIANCEVAEECLGIGPLKTSPAMATPIEHSAYELVDLPKYEVSGKTRAMPWEEDDETFLKFRTQLPLEVTSDVIYEKVAVPLLNAPIDGEQRSDAWHMSRLFAVTASQFASASNENPTFSSNKLLTSKTYPKANGFTGNAFTEWGVLHEKHAEESFIKFLCETKKTTSTLVSVEGRDEVHFGDGSRLVHVAHVRSPSRPFLGFSPDGLLWSPDNTEVSLIEYKCPAFQRSGPGHPYAAKNELCIPRQYMPQLQGSMLLLREANPGVRCVRAWFVVWQAHQFFVTHVPYVPQFAQRILESSSTFFKDRFLPACAEAVSLRDGILKADKESR